MSCGNKKCNTTCTCKKPCSYSGPDIECLGITEGMPYDEAIQILGEYTCEIEFEDGQGVDHVSFIQSTGTPSTTPNQSGEIDTYNVYGDVEELILLGSFMVYNGIDGLEGADGVAIIPVIYSEAVGLYNTSEFIPGMIYHITDRDYFFIGLDSGSLHATGYRKQTILNNSAYVTAGTNLGVWANTLTPIIGDTVFWGGKSWSNLTGNVGTATDEYTLSADWGINTTFDVDKIFEIKYDLLNDWVSSQEDDRGNVLGLSYNVGLMFNPVDISDWGNELIYNNKVEGIYNNAGYTYISYNTNRGSIYGNFSGDIVFNSNSGDIHSNVNVLNIYENSNIGNIAGNIDTANISGNSNIGNIATNDCLAIVYNSNIGDINGNANSNNNIARNSNKGRIFTNTNVGEISDNINIGAIESNSNQGYIKLNSNIGPIANNSNNGNIEENINNGSITLNSNSGIILQNSNLGRIQLNTNQGNINLNTCDGEIYSNSCGNITQNNNRGYINANSNNGDIENNMNSGFIEANTSDTVETFSIYENFNNGNISYNNAIANINIYNNINNGLIGNIAVPVNRNVDITDPIVNK